MVGHESPFITDYNPVTRTPRIRFALLVDVSPKRRNLVRRWLGRSRPSNICHVVPLLPLRRIDNTDIVQCEHSFRPDGMIFRSSLRFFFTRYWSLTPAFHLQNYYSVRNRELLVRKCHLFTYVLVYYVAWIDSLQK